MLTSSEEVENLPSFKEFSDAYDNLKEENLDIYFDLVRNGMSEKEALRVLGDSIWEGLFKLYGVKPIFERR